MLVLVLKDKNGDVVKHEYSKDMVRIGRAKDNDLHLNDASVSRYHSEIRREDDMYFIYDMQSLNGTQVNGQRVKRASLKNNDKLKIGNIEALYLSKTSGKEEVQSDRLLINKLQGIEILQALNIQSLQDISITTERKEGSVETIADDGTLATPGDELSYKQELHRLRRAYRHLLFSYGLTSSFSSIDSREEFLERLVNSLFIAFDHAERAYVTGYISSSENFPIMAEKTATGFEKMNYPLCHQALLVGMTDKMAICGINHLPEKPEMPADSKVTLPDEPVRSMMCVPMVCQNEGLGLLYVENFTKPRCFDDLDLELMCVISVLSATSLTNIDLYERLARAYDDAYQKFHEQLSLSTTLCELGRGLTSALEEEDIMRRIVPVLSEQVRTIWTGVGLFRKPQKKGNCIFYHCRTPSDGSEPRHIDCQYTSILDSYLSSFVKESRVMSLDDLRRETSPFVPITSTVPHEANYCVFAPLIVKQATVGFLVLAVDDDSKIQDNQLAFINGAAYQTALAFETAHLFESIKEQQSQLRLLSNQILTAQEEERKRLARELHDDIGQIFSAMKLHLESLVKQSKNRPEGKSIDVLNNLATQGMEELRHISLNLRPPMLDDLGLIPTINWLAKDYSIRFNIQATVQAEVNAEDFDPNFGTNLFRIIQEALTNVAKHSGADSALILLQEEEGRLEVRVSDNGEGFDVGEVMAEGREGVKGFGLLNMKERAAMFNGDFDIYCPESGGTTLLLIFAIDAIRAKSPTAAPVE